MRRTLKAFLVLYVLISVMVFAMVLNMNWLDLTHVGHAERIKALQFYEWKPAYECGGFVPFLGIYVLFSAFAIAFVWMSDQEWTKVER